MIRAATLLLSALAAIAVSSGAALAGCDKSKPSTAPASRFVVNGGEAQDTRAKLVWRRCAEGLTWTEGHGCGGKARMFTLTEAQEAATQAGGGWRLPTIAELYGIVESACEHPAIAEDIFPDVKEDTEGAPYWTTSPVPNMPGMTYYVDFSTGYADGHSASFGLGVRLVKSSQ